MNGRVYSEVNFILENLEEEYISKVPKKLSAFCIPILYFTHYISFYNKEKYTLYNSAIKNMSFDVISLEIEDKKLDGYAWKFKKLEILRLQKEIIIALKKGKKYIFHIMMKKTFLQIGYIQEKSIIEKIIIKGDIAMVNKKKAKKEKSNKWLGVLVLILIIGPIIGMFSFLSIGLGGIAGSMFGLYFLIFGIICIINSHEGDTKIVEFIMILVGLIIIAIGILNQFGTSQIVEFINSLGITLLFLLFFTAIGIGMIIGPRMYERSALKRCKKVVIAECVNMEDYIKTSWGHEIIECSPIWQYTVNKEKYTYCNGIYDNIASEDYEEYREQMIGATCELFVNSKNPQDVFVKIPDDFKKRLTILGVGFLVSIGITIYFLFIGK